MVVKQQQWYLVKGIYVPEIGHRRWKEMKHTVKNVLWKAWLIEIAFFGAVAERIWGSNTACKVHFMASLLIFVSQTVEWIHSH